MADQMHTINQMKSLRILHYILFAFVVILGIEMGAGAFVTKVVFPLWASSPEVAIGWIPELPCYLEEGDFFMYSSIASMIAAIVTIIAAWRAPSLLKRWSNIAGIAFLIVAIWSIIYFIPIQDVSFKGEAGSKIPRTELAQMLQTFTMLNYLRQVILFISFVSAIHALGISYRLLSTQKHITI